jgi:hypothetical protein
LNCPKSTYSVSLPVTSKEKRGICGITLLSISQDVKYQPAFGVALKDAVSSSINDPPPPVTVPDPAGLMMTVIE